MTQAPVYNKIYKAVMIPLSKVSRHCYLKAKGVKRPHPGVTKMHCEECTAVSGKYVFLCNNKIKYKNGLCHNKYHTQYYHCCKK